LNAAQLTHAMSDYWPIARDMFNLAIQLKSKGDQQTL
jgi:hypothetical protein